ncbi:MAG: pyridoxal-phosphate dependent enzyme [Ignavibacteria bacterium]|nr:pyridoxal-phosphate dependent enzyme [Ignavibacteria bacterium]
MKHYIYRCSSCNKEFSPEKIENELIYLCPICGEAKRNQPLKGVLLIIYDYDQLRKNNFSQKLFNSTCGRIWSFPEILPLEYDFTKNSYTSINHSKLESVSLNSTPVIELDFNGAKLFAFDDTRNPTFSYKDRASILVALKAIQLGIKNISAASTGNAGSSIAGICARFGLTSNIFVPKTIPEAKRIQIQSYGAKIYVVDGSYDDAFDLCLEISSMKKWFNRNTAYNPLTIEGKKSSAYDILISFNGKIPENIFVPVGDGVIIGGMFKGFWELLQIGLIEKLPKLIAVQSSGSNAVVRYFNTKKFEFQNAETIADSICASAPRNLFMANEAISKSNGFPIEVTDEEILVAQKEVIQRFGIFVEPSSASTFAAFKDALRIGLISKDETTLLMFTGNGLKDTRSLKFWNEAPPIKKYDEWLKELTNEI